MTLAELADNLRRQGATVHYPLDQPEPSDGGWVLALWLVGVVAAVALLSGVVGAL